MPWPSWMARLLGSDEGDRAPSAARDGSWLSLSSSAPPQEEQRDPSAFWSYFSQNHPQKASAKILFLSLFLPSFPVTLQNLPLRPILILHQEPTCGIPVVGKIPLTHNFSFGIFNPPKSELLSIINRIKPGRAQKAQQERQGHQGIPEERRKSQSCRQRHRFPFPGDSGADRAESYDSHMRPRSLHKVQGRGGQAAA